MHPTSTSNTGVELIKKFEGCHRVGKDGKVRAYRDPVGIWTIGWGSTKGVRSGMTITQEEADELLLEDIRVAEQGVRNLVNVPLSQNQWDALVSFVFNLGAGNFKRSTLLRELNKGNYDAVPAQLARWNKGRVNGKLTVLRGLTRRRAAEGALFTMDGPMGEGMVQRVEADDMPASRRKTKAFGLGLAGIGTTLGAAQEQLMPFLGYSQTITAIFVGIVVVGLAVTILGEVFDSREATL